VPSLDTPKWQEFSVQRLMDLLDTPKVHQPLHRKFLPFWCVKRGHCGTGGGCRDGGTSEHFEQIGDGDELECPWAHDTQKERGLQKAAHRFWRVMVQLAQEKKPLMAARRL